MRLYSLRRLAEDIGLVLVSGSPRRRAILTEAGIPFLPLIAEIEESHQSDLTPADMAVDLARRKVAAVAKDGFRAYLGCDTIVVLDGQILTKPTDAVDAKRMLKILSGRSHSVFTGLALCDSRYDLWYLGREESRVRFRALDDRALDGYIATGEPLDKAGAYGIQGMGGILVDSIEGNIDNIVGLPMNELERMAARFWDRYAR